MMLWSVWGVKEPFGPYGGAVAAFWFSDQFLAQTLSAKPCSVHHWREFSSCSAFFIFGF